MKENSEDISKKTSLLFVCLGNICRSPAAEGIMRHITKEHMMEDYVDIDSAGIGSWHAGELPDRRMRSHGSAHGYDFSSRARQIKQEDMQRFDHIIVMDDENYKDVTAMARTDEQRRKISRMTDFCKHHPVLSYSKTAAKNCSNRLPKNTEWRIFCNYGKQINEIYTTITVFIQYICK